MKKTNQGTSNTEVVCQSAESFSEVGYMEPVLGSRDREKSQSKQDKWPAHDKCYGKMKNLMHSPTRSTPDRSCKYKIIFKETSDQPKMGIEMAGEKNVSGNDENVLQMAGKLCGENVKEDMFSDVHSAPYRVIHSLKQTSGERERDIQKPFENRFMPSKTSKSRIALFKETVQQPVENVEITRQESASTTPSLEPPKILNYAKDDNFLSKDKLVEISDLKTLTSSFESLDNRKNIDLNWKKHQDKNRLSVGSERLVQKYCGSSIPIVKLIRMPLDDKPENEDLTARQANTLVCQKSTENHDRKISSKGVIQPFGEESQNGQGKNTSFCKSNDDAKKPNVGRREKKEFKENSNFIPNF